MEHREGRGSAHVWKYKIFRLVHVEEFSNPSEAILREKHLKRWRRVWKDELIEDLNPNWHDLFDTYRGDPLLP
jgi:putative endonuclease